MPQGHTAYIISFTPPILPADHLTNTTVTQTVCWECGQAIAHHMGLVGPGELLPDPTHGGGIPPQRTYPGNIRPKAGWNPDFPRNVC